MSNTPKSNSWYVRTEDGIGGPYTISQLRTMVQAGTLDRHTAIRSEGGSSWIRAGQYPAIFSHPPQQAVSPLSQQVSPTPQSANSLPPPIKLPDYRNNSSSGQLISSIGITLIVFALILSSGSIYYLSTQSAKTDRTNDIRPPDDSKLPTPDRPDDGNSGKLDSVFTSEQIVSMTEASVATITAGDGVGSGFIVEPGVVVTNYHVIADDDGSRLRCIFTSAAESQRGPFQAEIVAEDPRADLALLKITSGAKPLALASNSKFRRGQDIIAIGTPALFKGQDVLPNAVTRGIVSAEHQLFGEPRYQLSMAINPGNSGGPVIGLDAKVVGVVVAKSKSEEGIAFCVPVSSLKNLLDAHRSNNFEVTESVLSQHHARLTAREMATLTLALDKFLLRLAEVAESKSGESTQQLSANVFSEIVNRVIVEVNPGLRKNFAAPLRSIMRDDKLSPKVRSELETLLERHLALHAALDRPSGNVQRMLSTISNLRDRFLEQLRRVDTLLPLGVPELVE